MSDTVHEYARPGAPADAPVLQKLSTLDRFLPVWIIAAMALGLALGRWVPGLDDALSAVEVGNVSLPIAIGLLLMMYPVLAKVRYSELDRVTGDRKLLGASLVLNWVLGPALMFALAWLLLPDLPEYRTGLIIVGLARCIAMVLIWNDLSCGDREAGAVLVAINSVFQIVAFAALGWFYLQVLPGWLGLSTTSADFSFWAIVVSVLVFLGIPLVAGFLTRTLGERRKGRAWYEERFLPASAPSRSTGCCSPSSCSSRCRARRSPPSPGTSPASRCRSWPTSRSCSAARSCSACDCGSATPRRPRWPSPPPATTSSWPSPSPSEPSGSPAGRHSPASSGR
ncbi:hypothetical protein U6N30_20480 [Blastococcus brunescens]|uniref:Arsenical-resistance protein n=1 Tax=Blastococcus brunescens TaxID=1564165 RepID=A0ABZ1AUX9_9ACTN|nr:hypothetical protein [Blastococcus sp. BMG 8361]WRL62383.1 hypothetical protein U6N30_20480 [Blastococcus sp. BMG 8361]